MATGFFLCKSNIKDQMIKSLKGIYEKTVRFIESNRVNCYYGFLLCLKWHIVSYIICVNNKVIKKIIKKKSSFCILISW